MEKHSETESECDLHSVFCVHENKRHTQNCQHAKWEQLAGNIQKIPLAVAVHIAVGVSVKYHPGKHSAENQRAESLYKNFRSHNAPLSRSSRSRANSSFVRPLSHRAAAKAGKLPPQTFCTKQRLCWAR